MGAEGIVGQYFGVGKYSEAGCRAKKKRSSASRLSARATLGTMISQKSAAVARRLASPSASPQPGKAVQFRRVLAPVGSGSGSDSRLESAGALFMSRLAAGKLAIIP